MNYFQFHIEFNLVVWEIVFQFLNYFLLFLLIFQFFLQVSFWPAGASSCQTAKTDPFPHLITAPNVLLDSNLNMNLNPETTVHDDMYNVKYRKPDTLYEPILFQPLKKIRVSSAMFKQLDLLVLVP